MTVQVPAQTLERLRNWQRSITALNAVTQATVDALCEAQGLPPGAQIALETGVWVAEAPEAQAGGEHGNE